MIRVFEILRLEPFGEFQLQAGESGLQNEVTNVTILDYETDARDYSDFRPGDFILSSLYFAKNDESLILEAFRSLLSRGISGFAIKTVYYFTISDQLRRMADAAGVPVFTFRTAYSEDIIIAVNQLMREKDLQAAHAGILRQLLRCPPEASEVSALSHRLDDRLLPHAMAAYATLREEAGQRPLPSRQTTRRVPMEDKNLRYSLFVYEEGVLLLLTAHQPLEEQAACRLLLDKLGELRLPPELCRVGFGRPGYTRRQLDACIAQALQANRLCRLWQRDQLRFGQLGMHRFLLPLLEAPGCREECRRQLEVLVAYDTVHSAALVDTLTAFVHCRGDIKAAAAQLFQHPNTVRYRIRKVRQLWGDPEDFEQQAALCVQLSRLEESLRLEDGN